MTDLRCASRPQPSPVSAPSAPTTARWLPVDALAGLTVWALLVPQALAYAQLGGFDAVVGLYASIGALLGYALMGGVREMSVGPEATIALLTASIIAPLAEGDPSRYLALGAGVALMAGILLMLAGIARLGFVTRYLSRPLLVGYVAGSAIVMIVSQLDSLIGITLVAQDDTLAELDGDAPPPRRDRPDHAGRGPRRHRRRARRQAHRPAPAGVPRRVSSRPSP